MCVCVCERAWLRACVRVYTSKRIHVVACGPIGTTFGTHNAESSRKDSGPNEN